ncbi:peptidoglycan-binding domain-containing protein [Isoptericola variabilis]|uniref:peptidoglycan-binding domain-containing protein n=1 Tax=Isoptericola variabilis TaxID=139208 RepID=UPI003D25101E
MSAAQPAARRPSRFWAAMLGAVVALSATVGLTVVAAAPASAALPYCTSSVTKQKVIHGAYRSAKIPSRDGSVACQMAQGANGKHVSALQTALKKCYGQNIAVDGDFGPATKQALKNAQSTINKRLAAAGSTTRIGVDGMYGSQTRTYLNWPFYGGYVQYCVRL